MERYLRSLYDILVPLWPEAAPLLSYRNPFELLCAVVLSAQCTDEQVNRVTPGLFARYPDAAAMAEADYVELESLIHSTGFYRTKALHLIEASRIMTAEYGGGVPETMDGLLRLPGVGRKTANLVASACFGYPGIIVDTHVIRAAMRLGIHDRKDPAEIERVIEANLAPEFRTAFSHALNRHGKYVCTAHKPACFGVGGGAPCPLLALCPRKGL